MKRALSVENPLGYTPQGLAWEFVRAYCRRGRHLDYGTHDGAVLACFSNSGLIEAGVGLDVNKEVVERSQTKMPADVELRVIRKNEPLDLAPNSFDSISAIGVIEHIYDQTSILRELHRVLKPDGLLIVVVPGQHFFSFLDMGNLKFRFPILHRFIYSRLHSKEEYHARYVECQNGLFGDIEKEKMWHEHFSRDSMSRLLETAGFELIEYDGQGFFDRIFRNVGYFSPNFLKGVFQKLIAWDARVFSSCELVFLARKYQPIDESSQGSGDLSKQADPK